MLIWLRSILNTHVSGRTRTFTPSKGDIMRKNYFWLYFVLAAGLFLVACISLGLAISKTDGSSPSYGAAFAVTSFVCVIFVALALRHYESKPLPHNSAWRDLDQQGFEAYRAGLGASTKQPRCMAIAHGEKVIPLFDDDE